ncbi:MAG: Zn-dependent protease with chaperone function [Candidatus Methanohalarchaeum thermophilum]|uniref:Protease HtpX homolog n=1 Tax=Methanohalarchaeum thermophilum TaxID=1903181 RepID=A0A1Q6DU69_METT1|nr:MAG: Zn-dependent protease with chaperone function [Candidatus Methanohalarchaeum thermophilum]
MFENLKLKGSMYGSVATIVAVTTLAVAVVLGIAGVSVTYSLIFIVPFFLLQWYLGPKLVERGYNVKEASKENYPELHDIVEEVTEKSNMEKPKVMIADVDLPNAFAYGNYLSGDRVAVTKGLLKVLEQEEVEAVLGHELGHIKHNDSTFMMLLSILPALFLMIGRTFFWSSMFQDDEGTLPFIAVAVASMIVYFILQLCIMHFSRMREYYADRHSADYVAEGNRKLAEGLAKINEEMSSLKKRKKSSRGLRRSRSQRNQARGLGGVGNLGLSLKPLLISDPDVDAEPTGSKRDSEIVRKYANREMSFSDKLAELFSSHPNIKKRLKALGF